MGVVETLWQLHTLTVINSWFRGLRVWLLNMPHSCCDTHCSGQQLQVLIVWGGCVEYDNSEESLRNVLRSVVVDRKVKNV